MYAINAQQTFYIEMSTMANRLRAMLLPNEYNEPTCQVSSLPCALVRDVKLKY